MDDAPHHQSAPSNSAASAPQPGAIEAAALHVEPSPGRPSTGRSWRQARRAASLVLLVAAVGVLLNMAGALHVTGVLPRRDTVRTRVPNPATATARVVALYPYWAPAPGPGCDKGAAVWTLMSATPAHNVVCAPKSTQLVAAPLGSFVSTSLRGAPLPPRYAISLSVSGITPCTSAIWHVATATGSGFDLRLNGPAGVACGNPVYRLETTYPSGAGAGREEPYRVQTATHTIVIRVDETRVQIALDGVVLDAYADVAPPEWSVVQLGVSQLGGNGPASAVFSDFAIR